MELKNCKICGDLFLYNDGNRICPRCIQKEEEKFETVKSFLWDNPKATLTQVVENTGVEEQKIIRYVREGRIELADVSSLPPNRCTICGKLISQGRICADCAVELKIPVKSTSNDGDKFFNFAEKNGKKI